MTLVEAIGFARQRLKFGVRIGNDGRAEVGPDNLARFILSLSKSQPCGFIPPCTDQPGIVAIMCGEAPCYEFTPNEARWFAAELLRAADQADAANSPREKEGG